MRRHFSHGVFLLKYSESGASAGVDDAAGGQAHQGVQGSRPEGQLLLFNELPLVVKPIQYASIFTRVYVHVGGALARSHFVPCWHGQHPGDVLFIPIFPGGFFSLEGTVCMYVTLTFNSGETTVSSFFRTPLSHVCVSSD